MKLRHVVLLLLLANVGYAGWSHGLFRGLGWGPAIQSDPGRMGQQVAPDAVRIEAYSPALEKAAAAAPAPAPEARRAPAAPPAAETAGDGPPHEMTAPANSSGVQPAPANPVTP